MYDSANCQLHWLVPAICHLPSCYLLSLMQSHLRWWVPSCLVRWSRNRDRKFSEFFPTNVFKCFPTQHPGKQCFHGFGICILRCDLVLWASGLSKHHESNVFMPWTFAFWFTLFSSRLDRVWLFSFVHCPASRNSQRSFQWEQNKFQDWIDWKNIWAEFFSPGRISTLPSKEQSKMPRKKNNAKSFWRGTKARPDTVQPDENKFQRSIDWKPSERNVTL